MLEALAILAIITVLAILWLAGSLFAAVFLTLALLPLAAFGLILATLSLTYSAAGAVIVVLSVGVLAIIWAPRLCQGRPRAPERAYRG